MDFDDNVILMESLKNGDEKAYKFLLNKFHRKLNAYALTLVNDHSMAQDIVQNVFLKTWKNRNKLNPEFSIQSFLYKSVYNEFINTYQQNKAMMLLQQKYVDSLQQVVETTDESSIERMLAIINKEIQNLPPKCQKVFILSKKEGLTNIEIAEHLEISIKTVEAQISKAFKILKEKLKDNYNMMLFLLFHSPQKEYSKL
ncbi:RNA polymerase sigma-70 factor, ECF subfamily [Flavobacterium aquidurense]|uniref:RNA polymerase sigma-70 factor n=1 Tax=Flavobacterium frigidimaris TaxID=262320 RepID=A0ABX4BMS8_FLAFR|nr:RNA polymerase sigma-70 factor [Flavobacterium frigidimaris]OXA77402.1 RNA polymerase sigma-70 factor [Flavobacterium frigidimaris]SDZ62682.1 RNA polymerase sigma-70 factor, ECF subfamily [Flavobacterium aquidurense]